MPKVVSTSVMRESDAYTIANLVPSKELMRRAGEGIFKAANWIPPVAVVCGSGNNAGDGYVVAGLNWSSTHGDQTDGGKRNHWINFHSSYCRQNDYKLRYALTGTRYWGSYITDLIKLYAEVDSSRVQSYLNNNPDIVKKNISDFEEEIGLLGERPVLVALGGQVYKLLCDNLGDKYEIALIKHYSYTIGKEDYRKEVLQELSKYNR